MKLYHSDYLKLTGIWNDMLMEASDLEWNRGITDIVSKTNGMISSLLQGIEHTTGWSSDYKHADDTKDSYALESIKNLKNLKKRLWHYFIQRKHIEPGTSWFYIFEVFNTIVSFLKKLHDFLINKNIYIRLNTITRSLQDFSSTTLNPVLLFTSQNIEKIFKTGKWNQRKP